MRNERKQLGLLKRHVSVKTRPRSWCTEACSSIGKTTQETSIVGTRRGCPAGGSRMRWVERGKLAFLLRLLELLFPTTDTWWRRGRGMGWCWPRKKCVCGDSLIASAGCLCDAQMKADGWCHCGDKGYLGKGRRESLRREPGVGDRLWATAEDVRTQP